MSYRGTAGRELLATAALLLGVSGGAFVLARSVGPTRAVIDVVPFEEHGVFAYTSVLGRGVYDDDELRVPQPLFRRLGEQLPLTYTYQARSNAPDHALEGGQGWYSLMAEVRQANGWVRTVTLVPRTDFSGTAFEAAGLIDVTTLGEFIRRLETETGFRAPTFQVRVRAHVEFEGSLRAQDVSRVLDQTLMFTLNEFELRLEREGSEVEHFSTDEVTYETQVPRTVAVPLLGTRVAVATLPRLATEGLYVSAALTILVALASALDALWRPGGAARERVPSRYRHRVVDVDNGSEPPPGVRVRVPDLTSLLRLAEHYQLPALRSSSGGRETYWVVADSVYVFADTSRTDGVEAGAPSPAPPPPPSRSGPASSPPAVEAVPAQSTIVAAAPEEREMPREAARSPRTAHAWASLREPEAYSEAAVESSFGFAPPRSRPQDDLVAAPHLEVPDRALSRGAPVRVYWGGVWPAEDEGDGFDGAAAA